MAISPADLVATEGRIYTVDRARSIAESLAVRDEKIVFVGSRIDAQPEAHFPTLAAALDKASTRIPIQLIGSDGHHGAFNSAGLSRARTAEGAVVGFSKATLAGEFLTYRNLVGVDSDGNPSGAVNEDAKAAMGAPSILMANFEQALHIRPRPR